MAETPFSPIHPPQSGTEQNLQSEPQSIPQSEQRPQATSQPIAQGEQRPQPAQVPPYAQAPQRFHRGNNVRNLHKYGLMHRLHRSKTRSTHKFYRTHHITNPPRFHLCSLFQLYQNK